MLWLETLSRSDYLFESQSTRQKIYMLQILFKGYNWLATEYQASRNLIFAENYLYGPLYLPLTGFERSPQYHVMLRVTCLNRCLIEPNELK